MDIKSLKDFIEHTDSSDLWANLTLYRGQPCKGNLIPSIAREEPTKDTTQAEKKVLEQFKLIGANLLPQSDTELDYLVIAQHFGLKTRLLDWTSSPLNALWFACSSKEEKDAYVYMLEADRFLTENAYSQDPFSVKRTRIFQPRMNNARIISQNGWFTLHCYSRSSGRFVGLERNETINNDGLLTELRIPGEYKFDILRSLHLQGINRRTIYPDLDGLCLFLNEQYSL